MKLLRQFTRDPATEKRLLLFLLCSALAFVVGFWLVSPRLAEPLIINGGYYYMLGLFGLFVWSAARVARARREVWSGWLRRPGWPALAIAAATAFALWSDPFQHKVLFDEYVLQATAFHMHITKEVGTVIRAYDIGGTWLPIDTFLDKRPYFFTFLLSLVHDLTGFRIANVFFLNAGLTAACLSLAYWFGRELTNRAGGLLVVALLASMPLFGQNASCAGMEMHNLTMLVLVMCLALLYLRVPDPDRLALLCVGTVLLAQSRYESVIYVAPVALVIVAGWWRVQRVFLPWVVIATPLLLIPYAWHNRFVSAAPLLWQLNAGQNARFSLHYLADNLSSDVAFFFSFSNAYANSWYLSVLGCAGLAYFVCRAAQWLRRRTALAPVTSVAVLFGVGISANFVLLLFYYWSRLTDSIAARFALPACVLFALLAAVLARGLNGRCPVMRAAFLGALAYLLISSVPAMAHRFYTSQNLVMKEVDWEHEFVEARKDGPVLFISNKSTIPWILWKTPALIIGVARQRGDQLRYHMAQGTFHEVLVAQALRPTTPEGKFGVDPDDVMPDNFHLELLAEKRFGGRMARLSRLVRVDPEPPGPPKPRTIPSVIHLPVATP